MERLLEMLGVIAVLYVGYALSIKKWDYSSASKREERRKKLKEKGLSNTFYFISSRTLLLLNIVTGGLFSLYWFFKQWQAVLRGFKRQSGKPLKYGAFLRTLLFPFTFFELQGIINRTCEYLKKPVPLPVWFWGGLYVAGGAVLFALPYTWVKITGQLLVCLIPAVLQKKLNILPATPIENRPKLHEIIAAVIASAISFFLFGKVYFG